MKNNNTRGDKIDICNLSLLYTIAQTTKKRMNGKAIKTLNTPQEHIAEKLQHRDIELAKKRNTLRQKQYFENSQKYLGRLERASVSKNHNEHF